MQTGPSRSGQREGRPLAVMQRRHAGASYRTIAAELGVSVGTAHRDYTLAMRTLARASHCSRSSTAK